MMVVAVCADSAEGLQGCVGGYAKGRMKRHVGASVKSNKENGVRI